LAPHSTQPQKLPSVSRVHARGHDAADCAQPPLTQLNVLHVQVSLGAVSAQMFEPYWQPLHPVVVGAAHCVPSVSRAQACVHEVAAGVHTSLRHLKSVQVQLWPPPSSQTSANDPHSPHPVTVSAAQSTPSVSRLHAADSVKVSAAQVPAWQVLRVQVRLWVPLASQVASKPAHGENVPQLGPAPHALPWLMGSATHDPVAASHTPTLHSPSSDEQSTAPKTHTPAPTSHVPGRWHGDGGLWHWSSPVHDTGRSRRRGRRRPRRTGRAGRRRPRRTRYRP
jgi:hypothetical protein